MAEYVQMIRDSTLGDSIVYKELYIPVSELRGAAIAYY